MAKELKIWNGRAHGNIYKNGQFFVAAYTKKQACELIGQAAGHSWPISMSELNDYYSPNCWGNSMSGITPTEPCVYAREGYNGIPIRII